MRKNDLEHLYTKYKIYVNIIPANIYMFNINNRKTRKRCEICCKLTINISKVNMFKHNESKNIMKQKASLKKVKSEKKKDEHKKKIKNVITFLLFSLWSLEKIKISFCFHLLPSRNIVKLHTSYWLQEIVDQCYFQ